MRTSPAKPHSKRASTPVAKPRGVVPSDLAALRIASSPRISPNSLAMVFTVRGFGTKNDYHTNLWMATSDASTGHWTSRPFTSGNKDDLPEWSPDGSCLAFLSGREKAKPQIWTIPAAGGEARPLTRFPEGSLGAFKWAPDGRSIAVTFRPTAADWTTAAAKERETKGESDPPRVLEDIFYREDGDGYFDAQRYALYLVDTSTGDHTLIYDQDTLGTMTFDFAPDSRSIVVATDRRKDAAILPSNDELLLIELDSRPSSKSVGQSRVRRISPIQGLPTGCKAYPQFSPDGSAIAYAGHTGTDGLYATDNIALWICDVPVSTPGGRTGSGGTSRARDLTKATDYCLVGGAFTDTGDPTWRPVFRWMPDSRSLLVQIAWHGTTHIARIPRRGVRDGDRIMLTSGDSMISLGNISDDASTIATTRSTWDNPGEACIARFSRKADALELAPASDLNSATLRPLTLARPRSTWVKAADGTRVQAWVMQPPGTSNNSRKRRPAILMIHGGPHAQYGVGYFHEFQCLASAGYTVVFSNPRGSKGYGRAHTEAIRGDWGNKDWQDLQAVLAFMQHHPGIDANRLGVEGGSYGGYMTCWIVGRSRAFKAAISDRCVANLVSMGGNSDFADPPDRYWPGNFWDRIETRWAQSPIKDFGKVRTPMLIIHSEGDLRCNVEQSDQVFSALKLRKIPCRYVRYPRNCSHGLSRSGPPDMRLHRLNQILRWWNERL